jgi:hypothetical protein
MALLLVVSACGARTQTPSQKAAAALGGTSWQLVTFQGSDDKTLTPDDKAKYTIAFGTDAARCSLPVLDQSPIYILAVFV